MIVDVGPHGPSQGTFNWNYRMAGLGLKMGDLTLAWFSGGGHETPAGPFI